MQRYLAEQYVKANESLIKKLALRDQLMTQQIKTEIKTEVKAETNDIDPDDYLVKFETEAAGFLVDELPQAFVHKFLAFVREQKGRSGDEIDPFKVQKAKVDPNDPHLYDEKENTAVQLTTDDKKRPSDLNQK